jgi:hypothetical protein
MGDLLTHRQETAQREQHQELFLADPHGAYLAPFLKKKKTIYLKL